MKKLLLQKYILVFSLFFLLTQKCLAPSFLISKYNKKILHQSKKNKNDAMKQISPFLFYSKKKIEKKIPTDVINLIINFLQHPSSFFDFKIPSDLNIEMQEVFYKIDTFSIIIKKQINAFLKTTVTTTVHFDIERLLETRAMCTKYLATIDPSVFQLINETSVTKFKTDLKTQQKIGAIIGEKCLNLFQEKIVDLYFNGSKSNFEKTLIIFYDLFINNTTLCAIKEDLIFIDEKEMYLCEKTKNHKKILLMSEILEKQPSLRNFGKFIAGSSTGILFVYFVVFIKKCLDNKNFFFSNTNNNPILGRYFSPNNEIIFSKLICEALIICLWGFFLQTKLNPFIDSIIKKYYKKFVQT